MQVDVTLENIIRYDLDRLTGNTSAELLHAAKEAIANGTILTVRIPDVEETLQLNLFDALDSIPAPTEFEDSKELFE